MALCGLALLAETDNTTTAYAREVRAVDLTMHGLAAEVANPRGIAVTANKAGG